MKLLKKKYNPIDLKPEFFNRQALTRVMGFFSIFIYPFAAPFVIAAKILSQYGRALLAEYWAELKACKAQWLDVIAMVFLPWEVPGQHEWDWDSGEGERCKKCGDKDWFAGPVCGGESDQSNQEENSKPADVPSHQTGAGSGS